MVDKTDPVDVEALIDELKDLFNYEWPESVRGPALNRVRQLGAGRDRERLLHGKYMLKLEKAEAERDGWREDRDLATRVSQFVQLQNIKLEAEVKRLREALGIIQTCNTCCPECKQGIRAALEGGKDEPI